MRQIYFIAKKELTGYFFSPIAYVFICVFLLASMACTFYLGNFFASSEASLSIFFRFHPWLYLFLIPAVGMRLWAEERNSGTLELLLTLPIRTIDADIGKFLRLDFYFFFSNFSGVLSSTILPSLIIITRLQTASISSKICVDKIIALFLLKP